MKKILLAISLIFLFATCSFAEDMYSYLQRYKASHGIPTDEPQSPKSNMDTYVITGNNGRSEVFNVLKLDNLGDDTYAIIDNDGNTTVIMKMDD